MPHTRIQMIEKDKKIWTKIVEWSKTENGKGLIMVGIGILVLLLLFPIKLIIDQFTGGSEFMIVKGTLTISKGNDYEGTLTISGYKDVTSIIVKEDTLMNTNKLIIKGLIDLIEIF